MWTYSQGMFTHIFKQLQVQKRHYNQKKYELFASKFNIKVIRYHSDNGIFARKSWKDEWTNNNQITTYSAVSEHHQNGVVERMIQEYQNMERSMIIHANILCPDAIN